MKYISRNKVGWKINCDPILQGENQIGAIFLRAKICKKYVEDHWNMQGTNIVNQKRQLFTRHTVIFFSAGEEKVDMRLNKEKNIA